MADNWEGRDVWMGREDSWESGGGRVGKVVKERKKKKK